MIPTFTLNDIFVMMQTLNAKTLIGFADPFQYLTKQEVEKEWERTYKKLHKLKLLDFVDGEVKLEEGFANALWIMSRTNMVVEILRNAESKSLFYFGTTNVVECSRNEDNAYTLYTHGTPDTTWNEVIYPRMLMGVEGNKIQTKTNNKIIIPTREYREWVKNGEIINEEKLVSINENQDVGKLVNILKQSFQNRINNNRLMIFYRENNKWTIEGLHVLTSPNQNWTFKMIRKNEMELLEGKPSTNIEIVAGILDVLRRVKEKKEPVKNS
ncbi:hypothetical protein WAX74_03200 [Psychrobacillus sp. FJAT-51614]|uniref:Uncharacterized protein n=1 Tax=Psychrobacillus mangrovi TaxID=3117745 RepID=A0ABU8F0X3_9BACI